MYELFDILTVLVVVNSTLMYILHSTYCVRYILAFHKTSEECVFICSQFFWLKDPVTVAGYFSNVITDCIYT